VIERKSPFWRLIPGPIVPFIAETGGQNAMIVDSSALAE
jgi:delta 1-pyrroline-5-carboxylate dehydrogenase